MLGIFNAVIRPLPWILMLPLTAFTFGLFTLLINALMVKTTADMVSGFEVDSFGDTLLVTVIMALSAIAGFILLQWFLFDTLFWLQMGILDPHFRMQG